jgi:hypothetical protein
MKTLAKIILSIVGTKESTFVEKRLVTLENQLNLNEIEKRILEDIRSNLQLKDLVSTAYLKDKYSYYFVEDDLIPEDLLQKEAIDSAIVSLRVSQLKENLSKDLISLGGKVITLSPKDIKVRLGDLHNSALIESKYEDPVNIFSEKEDPYSELQKKRGGLSLLLPEVEKHAGKASLGTTVSILAASGHGKSAYALNLAYANAMDGKNILYLTLEDTSSKLKMRLVLNHIAVTANNSKELINASWVRDNKLSQEQKDFYNKKHNEMVRLLDNHLLIWDTDEFHYDTFLDMEDTLRKADKMFKENTDRGLDAVFIDHVSLLKYTIGSGKKYGYDGAVINDWVLFFNNQALNFLDEGRQITVFNLSQVKREAFSEASKPRKKGRYELDCASDASEIERISTSMITLFKDYENNGELLINIPKAREGFVPDNPLRTEMYGEYFHIGPLDSIYRSTVTEDFSEAFNEDINLEDLI